MNKADLSKSIKAQARQLGFTSCGISKAEFLEKEAPILENWLNHNYNGKMAYMANHFDKRLDPRLLVEGAKSVISVVLNYYPEKDLFGDSDLKISKYAYGHDYHSVIKQKLSDLLEFILEHIDYDLNARVFTDSAPVLDKAWAERSGLGWQGKNGMLISKQNGSFFFVGEIIIDLELSYDQPMVTNHCGTCTKCIEACPTDAILSSNVIDGSKCISYLTIELKDTIIPNEFKDKMAGWFFGCDICQDVCPWNRFSTPTEELAFQPHPGLSNTDWTELTEDIFNEIFRHSAVKRAKFKGLKRNIDFVK
ncbi:MAG: tRNA epoxyqueuosine(34) reductase QueG [Putridiphycobacter sp.]|nr:tRNA epoxyqueuosine(34) reductase QueG [Putridiphycobacter sp.]